MRENIISKKTFADLVSVFFYPKREVIVVWTGWMLREMQVRMWNITTKSPPNVTKS